jgi:hypothetical protein
MFSGWDGVVGRREELKANGLEGRQVSQRIGHQLSDLG